MWTASGPSDCIISVVSPFSVRYWEGLRYPHFSLPESTRVSAPQSDLLLEHEIWQLSLQSQLIRIKDGTRSRADTLTEQHFEVGAHLLCAWHTERGSALKVCMITSTVVCFFWPEHHKCNTEGDAILWVKPGLISKEHVTVVKIVWQHCRNIKKKL